jgi:hypothetical protein
MTIKFNPDAIDSYIWTLNKLALMTVDIEVNNEVYPIPHQRVVISKATDDGLIIWEGDETGKPVKSATWMIPYEAIQSITVL